MNTKRTAVRNVLTSSETPSPDLCAGTWWPGNWEHGIGDKPWTHPDGNVWCEACMGRVFGLSWTSADAVD